MLFETWVLVAFTAVLAGATILYAICTWKSNRLNKKLLEVNRELLEIKKTAAEMNKQHLRVLLPDILYKIYEARHRIDGRAQWDAHGELEKAIWRYLNKFGEEFIQNLNRNEI